jgi:O-antigen/teichoic acid export membrane protein
MRFLRTVFMRVVPDSLARGALGTLALQAAYVGLSFSAAIVLARLLGVSGYGAYAFSIAWAGLLGVPAVLGFDRLIVRDVATFVSTGRWSLARGLLRRSNQLVLAFSTCLALLATAAGLAALHKPVREAFAIGMILVPLTALTLLRQASLQGLGRPVLSQLPELLIRPLGMIVVLAAIWLLVGVGVAPSTAMSINVVVTAFAFAVGALLLHRNLPQPLRTSAPEFRASVWLSASLPMMIISGTWIINGYVGTVMLGSLVDARSAGIFAVATRGADLVAIVLLAASVPLAPRLARLHLLGDREGLQRLVSRTATWTFLASLPLAAGLLLMTDAYLRIFGAGFEGGSSALAILVTGQLFNVAAGPVGILLLMTGFERWAVLGVACGTIVNITVNAALDPILGVDGAAIGAASSAVCWNLMLVLFSMRYLGVHPTVLGQRLGVRKR